MDQTVKLPSGKNFSKRDFVDVKRRASSEISCGFIITDAMLDCVQSDRQRVGQARQLFSRGVSTMFKEFYPDNVQKQDLAKFIDAVDEVCHMFTSRKAIDKENKLKNALGADLERQIPALKLLYWYIDNMTFDGARKPFQRAIKMAILVAIKLHELLKEEYDIPLLMLSRIVQDYLESFYMVVRDIFGPETKPTPLECCRRIDHIILGIFLDDESIEVEDIQALFEAESNGN